MRAAMSGLSFCRFACFFFSSSSSLPQTDNSNFDLLLYKEETIIIYESVFQIRIRIKLALLDVDAI
jgi:hypothetical protein